MEEATCCDGCCLKCCFPCSRTLRVYDPAQVVAAPVDRLCIFLVVCDICYCTLQQHLFSTGENCTFSWSKAAKQSSICLRRTVRDSTCLLACFVCLFVWSFIFVCGRPVSHYSSYLFWYLVAIIYVPGTWQRVNFAGIRGKMRRFGRVSAHAFRFVRIVGLKISKIVSFFERS